MIARLTPKEVHRRNRMTNILNAMKDTHFTDDVIPVKWIEELYDLNAERVTSTVNPPPDHSITRHSFFKPRTTITWKPPKKDL